MFHTSVKGRKNSKYVWRHLFISPNLVRRNEPLSFGSNPSCFSINLSCLVFEGCVIHSWYLHRVSLKNVTMMKLSVLVRVRLKLLNDLAFHRQPIISISFYIFHYFLRAYSYTEKCVPVGKCWAPGCRHRWSPSESVRRGSAPSSTSLPCPWLEPQGLGSGIKFNNQMLPYV